MNARILEAQASVVESMGGSREHGFTNKEVLENDTEAQKRLEEHFGITYKDLTDASEKFAQVSMARMMEEALTRGGDLGAAMVGMLERVYMIGFLVGNEYGRE